MPNRFSVTPLGGLNIAEEVKQTTNTLVKERNLESMKQEAVAVFQSEDPDKIAEYMLEYPEMQEYFEKALNTKDKITRKNITDSNIRVLSGEDAIEVAKDRVKLLRERGANPKESIAYLQKLQNDPNYQETAKKEAEYSLALRDPARYTAYMKAKTGTVIKAGSPIGKLHQDFTNGIITPEEYDAQSKKLLKPDEYKPTSPLGKLKQDLDKKVINLAEYRKMSKKLLDAGNKPYTSLGKIKSDYANGTITADEYGKLSNAILNPKAKNKMELTRDALNGDADAINLLQELMDAAVKEAKLKGKAAAAGKFDAIKDVIDVPGVAKLILEGKEGMDNVRNTFGVPLQELVRAEVLKGDPNFNFNQPRARFRSLNASLGKQESRLGAMGSFVQNINDQVTKIEQMKSEITSLDRIGIRALDVPWRQLKTRFIGSGHEQVLSSYMKEISAEIQKLSMASEQSVAQLPEENRKEWEKIHDPNLSIPELIKVLNGTRDMANIRHQSVKDERDRTLKAMENLREYGDKGQFGGSAPPEAVEHLRNNPGLRDAFEKKYGYVPEDL